MSLKIKDVRSYDPLTKQQCVFLPHHVFFVLCMTKTSRHGQSCFLLQGSLVFCFIWWTFCLVSCFKQACIVLLVRGHNYWVYMCRSFGLHVASVTRATDKVTAPDGQPRLRLLHGPSLLALKFEFKFKFKFEMFNYCIQYNQNSLHEKMYIQWKLWSSNHWILKKKTIIFQMSFSAAFTLVKTFEFQIQFHESVILRFSLKRFGGYQKWPAIACCHCLRGWFA